MAWTASGVSPARFGLVLIHPMNVPSHSVQAPKKRVPVPFSSAPKTTSPLTFGASTGTSLWGMVARSRPSWRIGLRKRL